MLSQAAVLSTLIPAVRTEWRALFKSVTDQTISTADLSRQFGTIHNKQQREGEVRMLVTLEPYAKLTSPRRGPALLKRHLSPTLLRPDCPGLCYQALGTG